jgi:hypothetical protein
MLSGNAASPTANDTLPTTFDEPPEANRTAKQTIRAPVPASSDFS